MASKASMLKNGVNKASKGLFAGMTPLAAEQQEKKPESAKNVKKTVSEEKVEATEEKAEKVAVKEEKPETSSARREVEQPKTEVESETTVQPQVAPVQEPVVQQTVSQTQPVQPQVVQQPIPQPAQPYQQIQQIMPEPQYQQPYIQQPQQYQPVQQMPSYTQMPVNNMQQMPYEEPKTRARAAKQDKASRYEKDKFLLLDIRGYRDYVEHMAKASNMSATKYIRNLIEQDMARNMDIYEAHKALEERLKGRR